MAFFAASTWAMIGAATSVYGVASSSIAQNQQAAAGQRNAARRYNMQNAIAGQQMVEQESLALEKMTEVSRQYFAAKGTMTAVQAETMVGGNVAKQKSRQLDVQSSEAKGQVAKQANANIRNIASDMLASKIDLDATLAELEAKKKNSLTIALEAGLAGANSYFSFQNVAKKNNLLDLQTAALNPTTGQ